MKNFMRCTSPRSRKWSSLINRCIGGGYNNKGDFWEMAVVTLGMVFCDTVKGQHQRGTAGVAGHR